MTKLNLLKKTELVSLASELGISTDGFKSDLETRILEFLQTNPVIGQNPKYAPYLAVSPTKRRVQPSSANSKSPVANGSTSFVLNTPQTFASVAPPVVVKHSPEVTEDEDDDDDEDEEDELKTTETILERIQEQIVDAEEDSEDDEDEDEEEEDEDTESAIEKIRQSIIDVQTRLYEGISAVIQQIIDTSDGARLKLSNVHVINLISVLFELGLLIKAVPLYPFSSDWKETLTPYLVWCVWSVILPLIISYYVNFTVPKPEPIPDTPARRTRSAAAAQASKPPPNYSLFDPLVFVLIRTVLAHITYIHPIEFLNSLPVLTTVADTVAQSVIILQRAFGEVPYISGFAAIVVVIYAAAL